MKTEATHKLSMVTIQCKQEKKNKAKQIEQRIQLKAQ
jgi:hypothetical protein